MLLIVRHCSGVMLVARLRRYERCIEVTAEVKLLRASSISVVAGLNW